MVVCLMVMSASVAHAADLDTRGRQDVADHVEDDDVEDVNIHGRHRRLVQYSLVRGIALICFTVYQCFTCKTGSSLIRTGGW